MASFAEVNLFEQRRNRAEIIAASGSFEQALSSGKLSHLADITLSEAIVLGLLRQNVTKFFCVLGHGSTEVGDVLRVYEAAGLVRVCSVRSEIEASHAATALRWVTGEKAAVITSIGPGALQAMAASLAAASNGLGVWYLLGDETTEDEGMNMQQIPKHEQGLFLRLFSTMGEAYSLHTPSSIGTALRRGQLTVDHPHRGGPFYLLMPMNTQPAMISGFNLEELPYGVPPAMPAAIDDGRYEQAVEALLAAERIVLRVGGGGRHAGKEICELLELVDGVAVLSPLVTGVVPYENPRNMLPGGSKGTICGNFAMEEADLLLAIGTRFVCQSDSSRTAFQKAQKVIHINTDTRDAMHYGKTIALVGDAAPTIRLLIAKLNEKLAGKNKTNGESPWFKECKAQRHKWEAFKKERYSHPTLHDEMWNTEVLTQPAAIKVATDWARAHDAVSFFDAGDVQANGFQIVEDSRIGQTFTDTGASYMGWAVSALLASGVATKPFYGVAFTGDGSFMMNPQILIDGLEHEARGCILLFDNRRMAAISSLQSAQYGIEFATWDHVEVDYVKMASSFKGLLALDGGRSPESLQSALDKAFQHDGLSLIHVPVYYGEHELGGLGAFGRWNVGNWVGAVQALRHKIGL